ncbi:hypothetical protein HBI49_103490 [Parastagonospora nodorum]|nr:hypothetical protein HBI75_023850 [Parastagonospora nodorum]KAH5365512.1 hypothetical protein HBI49_103490 [Parastagonospora nodorum]KAH5762319.1 hypothetical protein HBI17_051090 [Parastagonospora nodorum]KAH6064312.1 hypothetical protein HBI67_133660 [Parastagonospora nodorum]KAH6076958.1 hypothetical protein HBI66_091160 [Parastagonospora nodorum]
MTTSTPFLSLLPPELRLQIYSQLLVAPTPLKGPTARQVYDEKYDIHTAVMRTNKQVYTEARHVFFGMNTFRISSIPPQNDSDEGSGAFEPPLQLQNLNLIRYLEVDLLYYQPTSRTTSRNHDGGWKPMCNGADRYITSLSYLLGGVKENLRTIRLGADVRPYVRTTNEEENSLDISRFITGFQYADHSSRFKQAIAALPVRQLQLRFDFPETYFDFKVEKDVLNKWSWVYLAGQVALKKSEVELREIMGELGEEETAGVVDGIREGAVMLKCMA